MKIRTMYDPPPIPLRQFDWSAIDEDTYDGAPDGGGRIGYGRTEQEAIDELMELLNDTR